MNPYILSVGTLLQREVIRFVRQKNRIVGALGTPVVFWLVIGAGVGKTFRMPGSPAFGGAENLNYLQYFFPGTIILNLLFTAIFSTISVIEDRREGFLQGVLVSPVPRSGIVLGKLFGGTILASGQGLLLLGLAPLMGISLSFAHFLYVCLIFLFLSFALTGVGFTLAWRLDSTQGFHAIMNLFLMPLWLLSGALFPASGAPAGIRLVMQMNPLTYGVAALQRCFFKNLSVNLLHLPSLAFCMAVNVVFCLVMYFASVFIAAKLESPSSRKRRT